MSYHWLAWLVLLPTVTIAATRAEAPGDSWWGVVVGVGQYDRLDPSLALDGPPNDVPLVLTWLRRQGVPRRHLTVLADRVAGADGLPTRAAILGALQTLPARMKRGDIAFLYLAGHGSQQPQGGREWSKADGLDEIFLPRDVGRWDGASGQVEGAIAGREIGLAVQSLRARGIFVWLVFDSCHSATMARALMLPHLRLRAVPAAQLGVPAVRTEGSPVAQTPTSPLVKLAEPALDGGYVAFYAAQTVQSAPEMPLPPGGVASEVHGLFTYALLKALAAAGDGSYRDVAHRILAFYASTYPATTPEFEGALDGEIGAPGAPLRPVTDWPAQYRGGVFHIESGSLSRITPGSLLALYPSLSAPSRKAPLALIRVTKATLSDAWAEPVLDPKELKAWGVPADRSSTVASGLVRLLRTGVDLSVRLAGPAPCFVSLRPPWGCIPLGRGDQDAVERARRMTIDSLPRGAELTADTDAADLFLVIKEQQLLVIQRGAGASDGGASVDLTLRDAADKLRSALSQAVRSIALLRLVPEFSEPAGVLEAEVRTREAGGRWRLLGAEGSSPVGSSPVTSPPVTYGAEISVQLQNMSPDDLDVTILAIDDRFAIAAVYPVDQESNLLRAGSARVEVSGWARSLGENQLVFIIEKARDGRPHDLGYLAQPGAARHDSGSGLADLLERIGFSGRSMRSNVSQEQGQSSFMKVVRYVVTNSS